MSHRSLLVAAFVTLGGLVPLRSAAQIVSPYGDSPTAYPNTTNNVAMFTVYNVMGWTQTLNLTCSESGSATACSVASPIEVGPDETVFVGVSWSAGELTGAGSVELTASGPGGSHQNSHFVNVVSPVSVDFHRGSENQSAALCAAGCFTVRHIQSTVPYFSGNQPRSLSLMYDGDRAHARPFVYADVSLPYSPAPQKMSFRVMDVETDVFLPFVSGSDSTGTTIWYTGNAGHTVRVGGQIDARSYPTGARDIKIAVKLYYASGDPQEFLEDAVLIVVNEANSPIAKGWTLAGVPRLFVRHESDSSALLTDGAGSATFFRKCGTNCYTSPDGFASALRVDSGYLTLVSPDSTKIRFDTAGRAIRVTDRFADTVTFGYDAQYRLITVSDPYYRINAGTEFMPYWIHRYTRLVYDANGLSEIQELRPWVSGRVTKVSVGGTGTLDWIMDPDSLSTQFRYDDSVRLAAVINRRGDTTHFRYDEPSWKLKRTRSPLVQIDTGSGPTVLDSTVVALGPWQTIGIPTTSTSSSSPAAAAEPFQVQGTITDGESHSTSFTVDRWGQPLIVTDPGNGVTSFVRDGVNAIRIHHPEGGVDSLTYSGHKVTSVRPAGRARINYRYGAYSQVDSIWGTGIPARFFFLGANGRVDSVRAAGLVTARYFYDARRRVDSIKDAANHLTRFRYNEYTGQLDSITYPGNRWSKRTFDAFGRDSVVRVAGGFAPRTSLYDKVNRVVAQHDGVSADTAFLKYDPLFLIRVRDAKGQVFRAEVNALGWTTREYDPADTLSRYITYRYNNDGQVTSLINRRGDTLRTRFDALHRLVARRGTNIVADSFWYSSNRRQVVGLNSVSRVEEFLSTAGWVDSVVTFLNGTRRFRVRYKPTSALQLDSIGISTSTSIVFTPRQYTWHSATALLESVRVGAKVISFQRNAERLVSTTTWPASPTNVVLTESYTTLHQVYSSTYNHSALDVPFWRGYGFPLTTSRVERYTRKNGSASAYLTDNFNYDGTGKLTSHWTSNDGCGAASPDYGAQCGAVWTLRNEFDYDDAGNMDEWNTAAYSYTDGNRRADRAYDLDGNQTTRHTNPDSLRWDAANRLIRYRTFNGSKVVEFDYDAFGRLVRKRVNGVVRRHFLWERSNLLAELDSTADRRVAEYAYLPGVDRPVALITGATTVAIQRYFAQDELGNVVGVFRLPTSMWDNAPQVLEKNHYEPWGLLSTTSTTSLADTNRLRWKGLPWDSDVQMQYVRARWYDPYVGRFISEDPIGLAGGLNQYTFAGNDPINGRDPFGLDHCSDTPPDEGQPPPSQPPLIAGLSLSASCENPIPGGNMCRETIEGTKCPNQGGGGGRPEDPNDPRKKRSALLRALNALYCSAPNLLSSAVPEGWTLFAGAAVDFVLGVGATGAYGPFVDSRGSGFYFRGGLSWGWDASVTVEGGASRSFAGTSVEYQYGSGMFAAAMTTTQGGRWTGFSGSIGAGVPTATARMGASETVVVYFCTK
jgi:RHS repeat-associated protein